MKNYVILAIVSMFLFGINAVIQKKAPDIDSITFSLISIITSTLIIFIIWIINFNNKVLSVKGSIYSIISGIVFAIAFLFFIYSLRIGKPQIVLLFNGMSAGIAIILSFIILKESISLFQIIGIMLGLTAIIFFNLK